MSAGDIHVILDWLLIRFLWEVNPKECHATPSLKFPAHRGMPVDQESGQCWQCGIRRAGGGIELHDVGKIHAGNQVQDNNSQRA